MQCDSLHNQNVETHAVVQSPGQTHLWYFSLSKLDISCTFCVHCGFVKRSFAKKLFRTTASNGETFSCLVLGSSQKKKPMNQSTVPSYFSTESNKSIRACSALFGLKKRVKINPFANSKRCFFIDLFLYNYCNWKVLKDLQ